MVLTSFIYDIAGFSLGSDLDIRKYIKISNESPLATCFHIPEGKNYFLQKLFSSYALFSRNSFDYVRKMFGLIAHIESNRNLLHGGLTINEDKTILFLGNSASGKTTLSRYLGKIVDDDVLIHNPENGLIYVPSKNGFYAEGRSPDKKLLVASKNPEPKKPDVIFLLDKTKEGGFIEQVDKLSLEFYMPDYFCKDNTKLYIDYNNFSNPKNIPIYKLGTNRGLEKTIELVYKVI